MNDPLRITDAIADMKSAIDRAIERKSTILDTLHGVEVQSAALNPRNPYAGSDLEGADLAFSTGYDGTNTVTPFQWNISIWGSGDVWTVS